MQCIKDRYRVPIPIPDTEQRTDTSKRYDYMYKYREPIRRTDTKYQVPVVRHSGGADIARKVHTVQASPRFVNSWQRQRTRCRFAGLAAAVELCSRLIRSLSWRVRCADRDHSTCTVRLVRSRHVSHPPNGSWQRQQQAYLPPPRHLPTLSSCRGSERSAPYSAPLDR